jgi:hypothetical protein
VVTKTAEEGVTAAKPFLSQAINFLTTTEPVSHCTHSSIAMGQPPAHPAPVCLTSLVCIAAHAGHCIAGVA